MLACVILTELLVAGQQNINQSIIFIPIDTGPIAHTKYVTQRPYTKKNNTDVISQRFVPVLPNVWDIPHHTAAWVRYHLDNSILRLESTFLFIFFFKYFYSLWFYLLSIDIFMTVLAWSTAGMALAITSYEVDEICTSVSISWIFNIWQNCENVTYKRAQITWIANNLCHFVDSLSNNNSHHNLICIV